MISDDLQHLGHPVERESPASWQAETDRSSDEGPPTNHLPESSSSGSTLRLPALFELVKADLERKWRSGHPVSLESYLEILPELGTRDSIPAELILAEYEERRRSGEPAEFAEFANRFPRQAETLRRLIGRSLAVVPGSRPGHLANQAAPSWPLPESTDLPPLDPIRIPRHFGRYRIIRQLGQGAMGTVYLAHDTQLGRRVALKVPRLAPRGISGDLNPRGLERFYREVRAAAALHHPNLCPVYDQGEIGGVYYLTMAYLKGRPLSALIERARRLPERWVAVAVRKLALALMEAHGRGVIHRDLKPSNVMVTTRRELVIMDFGLAWQVGGADARLTEKGVILGTPTYMSPEQLIGDTTAIGPRCDIYSLGVILYEMLTGRRPFEGPATAVLAQILCKDPQPPSAYRPDLDPRLEAICLKAIAKNVEDRYATMAELVVALGGYLRGRSALTWQLPYHAAPLDVVKTVAPDAAAESTSQSMTPADEIPVGDRSPPGASDHPECPTEAGPARDEPVEGAVDRQRDSELKKCWRTWTAVVERFALRRTRHPSDPDEYKSLHTRLIQACRSRIEASDEVERSLYEDLVTLAQPWLTLGSLVQLDRELLFDLLIRCRQAELELHGLPDADQDPRDHFRAFLKSASRPMSFAIRFCFCLGMGIALLTILGLAILTIWQPDGLFSLSWR